MQFHNLINLMKCQIATIVIRKTEGDVENHIKIRIRIQMRILKIKICI